MLTKAFAVYHSVRISRSRVPTRTSIYTRAPLGPAANPTCISLRVPPNLSGWKASLLPPLPCHHQLLGHLLPVHPSCWPPAGRHSGQCDRPLYNNIGLCFAKSHSRASCRLKGNSGWVTRSLPISWDDCRRFQCSCPEPLSAGTPGRGCPAASGQTWPGSCCLPQRRRGSRAQHCSLSRLQRLPFGSSASDLWAQRGRS